MIGYTSVQWLTDIIINLLVPLIGLLAFLRLKKKIKADGITNPPVIELFIISATYGGMLLVILTKFFWYWSGMASLGLLYLGCVAPIIMGLIAVRQYNKKDVSKYHQWAFYLAILYIVVIILMVFVYETATRARVWI